jgi:signal transduction histidine kinase
MFLVLGTVVIVIIYVLTSRASTIEIATATPSRTVVVQVPGSGQAGSLTIPLPATASAGPGVHDEVVRQHSADIRNLLEVSWFVLALTAAASAVLGWFASGRVLRPVRQMTAKARTISAGNLGERLEVEGRNDEFKQLGDTFDDLLARLEASFEAQRRFVANASHELRTPLTVERTLLQVALADPDASAESLRATCEDLLASGREHERLLEALLTLARSERGLERREPVDLAAIATAALEHAQPEIERQSLQLVTALTPAATTGDPALIQRLIVNLVDNAVAYNELGGRVALSTAIDGPYSLVSVANTGAVIPADQLGRLFEPFQRLGRERSGFDGHYGLGLSLVRAIASAHGATVTATPMTGGGLTVTVSFPSLRSR